MGDLRERLLPGTTTTYFEKGQKGFAKVDMLIKATGGLNLSQVCSVTGLEGSTIQNWVKRGWVVNPRGKKYDEVHIARILIINALKECIKLEHIALLMRYVNGLTEDRSDDIIRESELFNYLCDALEMLGQEDDLSRSGVEAIVRTVIKDYVGPTPDAGERIRKALTIMIFACVCTDVKRRTEAMMGHVLKELRNPGMAADADEFNDDTKFEKQVIKPLQGARRESTGFDKAERGPEEVSPVRRALPGTEEFERAKQEIANRERAQVAANTTESAAKTTAAAISAGPLTAGQAGGGQASAGQASAGQASAEQASAGQADVGQASAGQASAGQASGGQVSAGQANAGQASADQAGAGQASAMPTDSGKVSSGQGSTSAAYVGPEADKQTAETVSAISASIANRSLKHEGKESDSITHEGTSQEIVSREQSKDNQVARRRKNTVIISDTDNADESGSDREGTEQAPVRRTVSQALREWDKKAADDSKDVIDNSQTPETSAADRIVELAATGGIGSAVASDKLTGTDERMSAGVTGGADAANASRTEDGNEKPPVKPVYFRKG